MKQALSTYVLVLVLLSSLFSIYMFRSDSTRSVVTPAPGLNCQPRHPSTCGQVRIAGSSFFDYYGSWTIHGVQFFLPQYGINGRSFWDQQYQAALADGSLVYWLDQADQYLHVNHLRVFVDLPFEEDSRTITPTSHSTLFDFALQANARGMRLGISLHNSDDWTLTAAQQLWIEELLSYFLQRDSLASIAYLNLDNEINNYCEVTHTLDCFAVMDQAYVDQAIAWVRQVRAVIKARSPQMLVTVGMSTELATNGNPGGVSNFFYADTHGDTIASLVDFLSPHNYGGRAAALIAEIREQSYQGPVVLEEYGFPTDPVPGSQRWSEGPSICRMDPFHPSCLETAPYYVELNLNALRTTSYAGGVAWMLADIKEKDLPTACDGVSIPPDLWTGLFAVGGQYCAGGTYTREIGQPKATAVRVCMYHTNNLNVCLQPSTRLPQDR